LDHPSFEKQVTLFTLIVSLFYLLARSRNEYSAHLYWQELDNQPQAARGVNILHTFEYKGLISSLNARKV
jgi:hypothetical protein